MNKVYETAIQIIEKVLTMPEDRIKKFAYEQDKYDEPTKLASNWIQCSIYDEIWVDGSETHKFDNILPSYIFDKSQKIRDKISGLFYPSKGIIGPITLPSHWFAPPYAVQLTATDIEKRWKDLPLHPEHSAFAIAIKKIVEEVISQILKGYPWVGVDYGTEFNEIKSGAALMIEEQNRSLNAMRYLATTDYTKNELGLFTPTQYIKITNLADSKEKP